jgi:hypothetical protein
MKICKHEMRVLPNRWTREPRGLREGDGWPSAAAVEGAFSIVPLLRAAETNECSIRLTVAASANRRCIRNFAEIASRICAVRDRVAPALPIASFRIRRRPGAKM